MLENFFTLRDRICTRTRVLAQPYPTTYAVAGKCWHNVNEIVRREGGSIAWGWALADTGPVPVSGCKLPSLYSRWINHVVWRDRDDTLWEVTPHPDLFGSGQQWGPAMFVADDLAAFEAATPERCTPLPAVYIALRPEGEWAADCLSQAERAPLSLQDEWLNRALRATQAAGFSPLHWRVERLQNRISDAWIMA